ncbi:MAG TPA: AAA family ATPase, partial [Acidimicrobiales bacterium]|nr:AAA family ATPase [Acidimicrobiales bacterium]
MTAGGSAGNGKERTSARAVASSALHYPACVVSSITMEAGRRCRANGAVRTLFAPWLRWLDVPFTCEACGAARDLVQIPAHATMLRCPQCGHERRFFRPPLLIITGTAGAGKSTICARLAGRVPGAVLLDADIFASDMISVVAPNADYPAFWRSMARLAHEIAQNNLAVVFFSVMLPQQLLANTDVLGYFESISFLCLTCDAEVLRTRFVQRDGSGSSPLEIDAAVERWRQFNDVLMDAVTSTDDVH